MKRFNTILFVFSMLLTGCFAVHARKPLKPADILKPADYKHFVDYFNRMENENIVQAIPDSAAWEWM
ncbi:MAG: glycoside hydrolase, partial [Bacteroidota bacterium]|nr:glycoside hydrolase [Bacteroidota bacterium]